ncbi:MAG: hypothetical protein NT051_05015, partial [Candidatus Micrarchaeota archaeon]|nr:hypothetical protein [Candidatus Micrarchaeota archaeon]
MLVHSLLGNKKEAERAIDELIAQARLEISKKEFGAVEMLPGVFLLKDVLPLIVDKLDSDRVGKCLKLLDSAGEIAVNGNDMDRDPDEMFAAGMSAAKA